MNPSRIVGLVVTVALVVGAGGCSKLTGLPPVPADLTAEGIGMTDLARAASEAPQLSQPPDQAEQAEFASSAPTSPLDLARWALTRIEAGDKRAGLEMLGRSVASDPESLVLGNAFRMATYRLKRQELAASKRRGEIAPELPAYLSQEPLATLGRIAAESPGPQIQLQIALYQVDVMILNPALEIKAPASIESTRLLTEILAGQPHYVPALYARGLNYLFRPRHLVWPEDPKPPRDAASRDLSLAAAAALQVGGAPARLRALVLMTLGDSHAHQDDMPRARSWWMLARETGADERTKNGIKTRMSWTDADGPDSMEQLLEEYMSNQEHPLSDLTFLWSEVQQP